MLGKFLMRAVQERQPGCLAPTFLGPRGTSFTMQREGWSPEPGMNWQHLPTRAAQILCRSTMSFCHSDGVVFSTMSMAKAEVTRMVEVVFQRVGKEDPESSEHWCAREHRRKSSTNQVASRADLYRLLVQGAKGSGSRWWHSWFLLQASKGHCSRSPHHFWLPAICN